MSILEPGKKIAICSDHAGYELKSIVEGYLMSQGIEYEDFGTDSDASCDYADYAHPCAEAVESGRDYPGIGICGSGNGINMTLNKHQGIRAALCWNTEVATLTRQHNDANVVVFPARFISNDEAVAMLDLFLRTPFEGGRHERRIGKMACR